MHAPHHVPKEWADNYKGVFDDGEAAVSLILGRELTEKLFGMSLQEGEDLY